MVTRFRDWLKSVGSRPDGFGSTYVITIRGAAGPAVRAAFDDLAVTVIDDTTVLRSSECDQAALHGILQRIQTLGLEVIDFHKETGEAI